MNSIASPPPCGVGHLRRHLPQNGKARMPISPSLQRRSHHQSRVPVPPLLDDDLSDLLAIRSPSRRRLAPRPRAKSARRRMMARKMSPRSPTNTMRLSPRASPFAPLRRRTGAEWARDCPPFRRLRFYRARPPVCRARCSQRRWPLQGWRRGRRADRHPRRDTSRRRGRTEAVDAGARFRQDVVCTDRGRDQGIATAATRRGGERAGRDRCHARSG